MSRIVPLCLLIISCGLFQAGEIAAQRSQPEAPASISQSAQMPNGKIVEKVVCAKTPTQSYALYVPSN